MCVVLTAASSTSASSSIATSSSTTTELLLLVHFFWLCYLNLTLQIKNKEEYVKCLRAALPQSEHLEKPEIPLEARRCTCCAPGQVSSTNAYPGTPDLLCHLGEAKSLSAFPRGHCFQSLLSCLVPTIRFTMEEVLRSHKAALSPGTTSRTRLLLSDCFTWATLNEQDSEKCTRTSFPGSYCIPYTLCMWMDCTIPLPTPEITIYQILTGKTNQNWHFQDRFPGCSSSCQPFARFLDLCSPRLKLLCCTRNNSTWASLVWSSLPQDL